MKGSDGGIVVCRINDSNFDPSSMTIVKDDE